jgi:ABC-2 type transport system ATP-binding protein
VFGQRSQLWYHLRVRDSFDLLAKIYGLGAPLYRTRAERIASVLQIEALLDTPVKTLSLGQRMRCEIAAALLHGPKVLFLDEPTIGLDVTAKALLREHLKHLADTEDTAIVLTSHDIGDIEQICARVILVNHGRILLDEPLENLRASFLREKRITIVTEDERPEPFGAGVVVERGPHRLTLSLDASTCAIDAAVTEALKRLRVRDLTIENAPLEEIIRHLYGEPS